MALYIQIFKNFSILSPYSKDSSYLKRKSGTFLILIALLKDERIKPLASCKLVLVAVFVLHFQLLENKQLQSKDH